MPIPFREESEFKRPVVVAWLRVVEDGRGVRAALFETSVAGEPLEFCFAGAGGDRLEDRAAVGARLAKSLFRASPNSPVLLLGSADDPFPWVDDLDIGVPFGRVRSAWPPPADAPPANCADDLSWSTEPPGPEADEALLEVRKRADPFEPLERTAKGLEEAFGDSQVRTLTGLQGLTTVISLPPPRGSPEAPETLGGPSFRSPPERENAVGRGLAERLWRILAKPRRIPFSDTRLEWPATLMPFQLDGVRALIEMDRLLLSDDMGLGKTVQAVAALRLLKLGGRIRSSLVVAPASVLDQWRREITKWAPELSAIIVRGSAEDRAWQWKAATDCTLTSYEVLRFDAGNLRTLRATPWDVVVLDEAQRIKNRNDTSEAVKNVPRRRSWALTGTPIENHEEDLASIMEFVDCDGKTPPKRYLPGAALLKRHREVQLRRKKSDVLKDLPPKLETKLTIALRPEQWASYEKAEREGIVFLKSLGKEVGIGHMLELITRLKQICNADPRTGSSSKLDDIRDRLRELTAQGHKALIFSQYVNDISGVAAAAIYLREFNPLVLTGDTPLEERSSLLNRFKARDEHKAIIISLRAGGLGLNLQEASYVFHLDRWWNPAVERQAEDRSHRLGQKVKVNVIKYSCVDTIEERIDRILEKKQELFDKVVDDVSLDLSARLSREEMLELFGLR